MVRATTRSEAVAMAKAFSIPRADSRIGISQIGRVTFAALLRSTRCASTTSDTCWGVSTLGMRIRSGDCGIDLFKIGKAERQLVDAYHALGRTEIDRAKSVAHQQSRSIFLGRVNGILQIEDDRVGRVQSGIDEVFGLVSGKVQTRASQAVARRRSGQRDLFRQCDCLLSKAGPADWLLLPARQSRRAARLHQTMVRLARARCQECAEHQRPANGYCSP